MAYKKTLTEFKNLVNAVKPTYTSIARETGLSNMTITNIMNAERDYTPSVTTVERISEYTSHTLEKLDKLKGRYPYGD